MFAVQVPAHTPPRGHLAVFPPATDYKDGFVDEIRQLLEMGWAVFTARPSYLTTSSARRGLQHPDGESAFWSLLKRDIPPALTAVRDKLGGTPPLVLFGFNLGGSVAASVAQEVDADALMVAGSIPRLSWFWLNSDHPVAASARTRGAFDGERFLEAAAPFDLRHSLRSLRVPGLIQMGRLDLWIERSEADALSASAPACVQVLWNDDGHDMVSAPSIACRLEFLRGIVRTPMVR